MKKILSGLAALALVCALSAGAYADSSLTDVTPGSWFYNEVSEMVAAGIIDGYEDGTFRPDRTVTVSEAVTMAARITGAPTGELDGFWAGVQMDHAYRSGWISESDVPRGSFNTAVTRELACKIIAAAFGIGYPAGTTLPFADAGSIGESYTGSVLSLYANGLLNGFEDGTLRPQDTLTRAQAATLLYRADRLASGEPESENSVITAAGYSAQEVIDYFCEVALGSEYGDAEEVVIRWAQPVYYSISGPATDADLSLIGRLCDALNLIPGFPGIHEAQDEVSANLKIRFVSSEDMYSLTGDFFNGYVTVWYSGEYSIYDGEIYYLSTIDQESRNPVIVEELIQSLGLLTDSYDYPESIFYQYHTDTDWPTTLDWALVQLLYSDALRPGMYESAVRTAAAALVR